jgi:hypothetical protein
MGGEQAHKKGERGRKKEKEGRRLNRFLVFDSFGHR